MTTPAPLCSNCGKKPVLVKKVMLCSGCYWRQKRHGTLDYRRLPKGSTALERFEFYVVRSTDPDGCWIWGGAVNTREAGRDYGYIWDGSRKMLAHRWSYEHFVRPIPDGLEIDHTCETPRCVRPDHLEAVSHPVNVKRGRRWPVNPDVPRSERVKPDVNRPNCPRCGEPYIIYDNGEKRCRACSNAQARDWWMRTHGTGEGTGARNREKTHCSKNHEYTPENTYVDPKTGTRDCKICRKERNRASRERLRGPVAPVTKCVNGHEYTPENTIIRPNGRRSCRECASKRKKRVRQRKRVERLNSGEPSQRRLCPVDCTCARHSRSGPRRRKQVA
jgi:hypothetical protein